MVAIRYRKVGTEGSRNARGQAAATCFALVALGVLVVAPLLWSVPAAAEQSTQPPAVGSVTALAGDELRHPRSQA
jgi:hypothetical protein